MTELKDITLNIPDKDAKTVAGTETNYLNWRNWLAAVIAVILIYVAYRCSFMEVPVRRKFLLWVMGYEIYIPTKNP